MARLTALERRPEDVYEDEEEGFVLTQRPVQRLTRALTTEQRRSRRVRPGERDQELGLQVEDGPEEPGLQQDELGDEPGLQHEHAAQRGLPQGGSIDDEDEALIGVFLDEIEQEELLEGRAAPYVDYYAGSPVYTRVFRAVENAAKGMPQPSVDYRHILGRADRACTHCGALY